MSSPPIDISIVIVNYNVKEFVASLLDSLEKAKEGLKVEVFVVDNASSDASVPYLKKSYPWVKFFENQENIGFAKANNQAIKIAKGKYTLLLNPDTILREDTLKTMYEHMEANPNTAAAGCKLLNPDGSFAPESRREVPTPSVALWKTLGLTSLFPESKRFGRYYQSWKDEDESGRVPVLSGAFMFMRTDVLKEMDGFDERFFMYGEDIDLCYRIGSEGYHIDYVPDTSIIHYKGESTKKDKLDHHIIFNKSNYLFFRKHFSLGYSLLFRMVIVAGIIFRAVVSYAKVILSKTAGPVADLAILNVFIITLFLIRFEIPLSEVFERYQIGFPAINVIASLAYLGFSSYYNLYSGQTKSIINTIKSVLWTFGVVALMMFFVPQIAFSRLIVGAGMLIGAPLMGLLRYLQIRSLNPLLDHSHSRLQKRNVLIVGNHENTKELIHRIRAKVEWDYEIIGVASDQASVEDEIENVPVIGKIADIPELIETHQVNQLFFVVPAISYESILTTLSRIRNPEIHSHIVSDKVDYVIGKTTVDYLEDMPLIDVEVPYRNAWNRFMKRVIDICISFLLLVVLFISTMPGRLYNAGKSKKLSIALGADEQNIPVALYSPYQQHRWKNLYQLMKKVFTGKISIVGAPLGPEWNTSVVYKPGVTGLRQLNEQQIYQEKERLSYELYYLRNYSIWFDLEIIFKAIFSDKFPVIYQEKSGKPHFTNAAEAAQP